MQNTWIFSNEEKKLIYTMLAKGRKEQNNNEKFAIIDFESFYKLFTDEEIAVMKKYLAIDPKEIDYKLPLLGLEDTPNDLVSIPDHSYILNGETQTIPCQYLPEETHKTYVALNEAMHDEIHKKLLVLYAYRSPARQVFMFFDILERIYNFDFHKTVRRVCFPAYSEHVYPKRQAIDFMTASGIKGEGFDKTDEYKWLQENASKFRFHESYQKDNELDMMYEPWHWHHE